MSPQAAEDAGLKEGDYVWVDADENDRPYIGWKDDTGPRHQAFRCMVRVKLNPGLPYNFTIMKHTGWIASERSVTPHDTRADGRAIAAATGYQASYRYASHQSTTLKCMIPKHHPYTLVPWLGRRWSAPVFPFRSQGPGAVKRHPYMLAPW